MSSCYILWLHRNIHTHTHTRLSNNIYFVVTILCWWLCANVQIKHRISIALVIAIRRRTKTPPCVTIVRRFTIAFSSLWGSVDETVCPIRTVYEYNIAKVEFRFRHVQFSLSLSRVLRTAHPDYRFVSRSLYCCNTFFS